MKKALALVLALVLALSMAVSAFALTFVELEDQTPAAAAKKVIKVVNADDTVLYVYDKDPINARGTTFYVALEDKDWKDVKVTSNGNVTAELVKFDPETMVIDGMEVLYHVTEKGEKLGDLDFTDLNDSKAIVSILTNEDTIATSMINFVLSQEATLKALKEAVLKDGKTLAEAVPAIFSGLELKDVIFAKGEYSYETVKALAKALNDVNKVTYYGWDYTTNVNVIKVVVEKNYTAHFTEGSIIVEAKLDKKDFKGEIVVINDVIIAEYEEVKWTAENFEDEVALYAGANDQFGYSDWFTAEHGYSDWAGKEEYDVEENRVKPYAAVVSTTAFRAIEGEDLLVYSADELSVALYDIVKGQKGVNFLGYVDYDFVDENKDLKFDADKENITAIEFGYYGDQVVKGDFEINLELDIDWYELRELFGLKVEEDDIVSYYVVDENGKVVGGKEVDYMTADLTEEVEFTIKGSNSKLGQYEIVLEVAAAEVGEANPNTGAESVVGVVAALAVVSVATAAAVSFKK